MLPACGERLANFRVRHFFASPLIWQIEIAARGKAARERKRGAEKTAVKNRRAQIFLIFKPVTSNHGRVSSFQANSRPSLASRRGLFCSSRTAGRERERRGGRKNATLNLVPIDKSRVLPRLCQCACIMRESFALITFFIRANQHCRSSARSPSVARGMPKDSRELFSMRNVR